MRTDLEIYDPVISLERLKRRMVDLDLRTDLAGPDLCLVLAHSYPKKIFIVKEHMLARGNPFNYHKMSLFPNGLVYGFGDGEINLDLWNNLDIPPHEELSRNIDFKGMTMMANLHLCYGEDLYEARKRREAVIEYEKARKIAASTREASVHNSLGIFFRREGWPVLARNEYEAALGARHLTANERSNIYVNLGNLEKDSRRMEDAIEFYLRALDINGENNDAKYNLHLTRAYKDINEMNYRGAAENFEKALDLPDSDPQINLNLGIIYDRNLHNKSRAVFYYKRFVELFPGSEQAVTVRDRIKELETNR
jgi:tetratricopeptide (TPR) repeat protein